MVGKPSVQTINPETLLFITRDNNHGSGMTNPDAFHFGSGSVFIS